jgi:hypothetical protein
MLRRRLLQVLRLMTVYSCTALQVPVLTWLLHGFRCSGNLSTSGGAVCKSASALALVIVPLVASVLLAFFLTFVGFGTKQLSCLRSCGRR